MTELTVEQLILEILKININYEVSVGPNPAGEFGIRYYANVVEWTRETVEVKNMQTGKISSDGAHIQIAEVSNCVSIKGALINLINLLTDKYQQTLDGRLALIANLNTNYEIEINSRLCIDGLRYTITIIETGHDFCVEKAKSKECTSMLEAANDVLGRLIGTSGVRDER